VNVQLLLAAVLALATGCVHSVLGERFIVGRLLRRDNLPRLLGSDVFTKQTIRFAWHLTTVAWWGLAMILLLVGGTPLQVTVAHGILIAVAGTFLLSALLALLLTRGRHLSWIVFLAIAVLCLAGLR